MININMSFATPQEAAAALERLYNLPAGSITNPGPMATSAADAMVAILQAKIKSEEPKPPKQPKAEKPAATPTAAEPAESTEPTAPATTVSESPSEITYDVVAKAITDGVKANRAKVVVALSKFGVKKGTELKPEQYAEFLEMLA